MPGKHLTTAKRQRFTSLRARGLAQFEAMQLVGISRQSAARIERSDEFKAAMASSRPGPRPVPGKATYELPKREMPMETAIKLLQTLRHITNPEGIQAIVAAVRDVIPAEILADELKALDSPALFPTGTDGTKSALSGGVSDHLPRKVTEVQDDPDPDRYGYLVPDLAMRPRTWSPSDQHLDLAAELQGVRVHPLGGRRPQGLKARELRGQIIRHARSRAAQRHEGLRFYQGA